MGWSTVALGMRVLRRSCGGDVCHQSGRQLMFVVCWQVVRNCVVDLRPLGSET